MNFERYGYLDNEPNDILESVQEMVENARGEEGYTLEQFEFRNRLVELLEADQRKVVQLRKGRAPSYIGAALVGRRFGQRDFHEGPPSGRFPCDPSGTSLVH